jgi:hypothetical protein
MHLFIGYSLVQSNWELGGMHDDGLYIMKALLPQLSQLQLFQGVRGKRSLVLDFRHSFIYSFVYHLFS